SKSIYGFGRFYTGILCQANRRIHHNSGFSVIYISGIFSGSILENERILTSVFMKSVFYTPQQARDITAQYICEQGGILIKGKNLSRK
ncbi:MAG: hypothetical protein Q8K26_02795, partial [Candidatus Gracilibacteria bacterium]|nr:hypothetical protein [Candidatus Gracilibacteria bacterium]